MDPKLSKELLVFGYTRKNSNCSKSVPDALTWFLIQMLSNEIKIDITIEGKDWEQDYKPNAVISETCKIPILNIVPGKDAIAKLAK